MFGACARQLVESALGIRQTPASHGWEEIVIDPAFDPKVGFVRGSVMTPKGEISVRWEYVDGSPVLEYRVPDGVKVTGVQ